MGITVNSRGCAIIVVLLLAAVPTTTAKYSGGTGEPNDPYQIAAAADLILLGESPDDYGKHFILTADIDLDPNLPGRKVFDKAVIRDLTGVFNGNGHRISHLKIRGQDYLGLFGGLSPGAEVRNLGVVDVNVVGLGSYVGGLAGENRATVANCYSTGAVSGSWSVGGLVGWNNLVPHFVNVETN